MSTPKSWPSWARRISPRGLVRGVFFVFFVASCVQLLRFAAWARGEGPYVPRPESPAGLLPIGHFTSFFAWLRGGGWDVYLPAGLVIIIAAIAVSFLFKRGFCGWVCPVGSVWEASGWAGRRLLGRNLRVPKWLDYPLRGVRYLIAAAIIAFLVRVPLWDAVQFRQIPYMWVADIKILGLMAAPMFLAVVGLTFIASMFFGSVWCRYLCPPGALYSLFGVVSPCTVVRDAETCIDCGACTRSCHAFVDVAHGTSVRDTECDGCIDCVRACPVDGALTARVFGRVRFPWLAWPVLAVVVWLAIYLVARVLGQWTTTIPDDALLRIINSGLLEQKTQGFF